MAHNGHGPERNGHAGKQDDAAEDIPFPKRQLTILAICRFSEPIAFNSILAYTYIMVKDLQGGDDTNASFYAGLLISAYAVAEAMTAMIWGAISDRYGRKPIVLVGLVGVAISSLIFGFAKTYWVAFLARFVGGALNGNVAVMQTMVAEMVKNPAHEPIAYAVQPFVWSLGSIIGAALGGFLAQPAIFYPSVFPPDGLFGRYPYLLPNLVAVVVIVIAVIQGIIFLEETNPLLAKDEMAEDGDADETSPLLRITSHALSIQGSVREIQGSIRNAVARSSFLVEEGLPTATDQRFDLRRSSFGTMHSIHLPHEHGAIGMFHGDASNSSNIHNHLHNHNRTRSDDEPPPKTFNFGVMMLTLALVLIAYHQMAFGSILPIHLLDDPAVGTHGAGLIDLHGGFGFTVHEVGTFMAVNGVIALFIQAFLFPVFVERVGVWHSFVWTVALYPLAYVPMPFLTLLLDRSDPADPSWALILLIYATMSLQSLLGIISGPVALILLKNATPSPLVLGRVNGFAMSATCAARTLSPPLVGIVYARGGSAAAWASCAAVAVAASLQLLWVPRDVATGHGAGAVDVDKVEVETVFQRLPGLDHHQFHHPEWHSGSGVSIPGVVVEEDAIIDEEDEEEDYDEEARHSMRRY